MRKILTLILFVSLSAILSAIYSQSDIVRELPEVVVLKSKQKYSKKNNPAVDLMQRIRATSDANNPQNEPYYNVDIYEKVTLALNNADFSKDSAKLKDDFKFIASFTDTARFTGKPIINISVREKLARQIWRKSPKVNKTIIYGLRNEGIDENFSQDNINKVFSDVLREIDIYSNDIPLISNRFVGPLSNIAADYYKYFITDTLDVDDTRCIELTFVPKTPESWGFNGKLYVVDGDSTCFIKKATLRLPYAVNINFVNNIFVEQKFETDSLGNRLKTLDDMVVEFQLVPGTPEIYARRLVNRFNPNYDPEVEFSRHYDIGGDEAVIATAYLHDEDFWDFNRQTSLTRNESRMSEFMEGLRKSKLYFYGEKVLRVIAFGYFKTGKNSKVDIGPINTMLSFNSVEGVRMRLGGYTTSNLSPHWFARGYAAYGTKDHTWKYSGEVEYSFNEKKYHSREFPINSIRLFHQYDLDMIGQHYLFTNSDNIFLSLKRKSSDLVTYRRLTDLNYTLELYNGFSFSAELRHEQQNASKWVSFTDGNGQTYKRYTQASCKVSLRYAPGETFVQAQSMRMPVNMDAWVLQLTHEYGPKGWLGSDFCINKTEFSMQKRLWFSAFGYLDMIARAGKIWSQVQFPALTWANANLSFTIQPESFALMNPMEFATDQYVSWDLTYWMNGMIFNRIPLFKKVKLREVVAFRGYYGSLTDKNNPALHPELFRFPADCNVTTLGRLPYMEISAGIDNIFKILRVDYVWRLSYRHKPGCDDSGLRVALHFNF